jgi:hypothetical protein
MKEVRPRTPIVKCTTSGVRTPFYTCPPNCRAKIPLVYIVNVNGNVSITFEIFKAATTSYFYIIAGKNFSQGEFLQLSDAYIVLEPGDQLVITCTGSTPDVDALCTAEELFIPVG